MAQTLQTWYRSTLAAKLNAADTTIVVATAPTVTAWRMHIYSGSTHAWIKYTGVSSTTLTGVTFVSQTADPATTVTGVAFPAWTAIELVEMHDQMFDKQQWGTIAGAMILSSTLAVTWATTMGSSFKNPVYADATARDAGIPSPANGMVIYNTALGILQQYIAGAWASFASWTTANADTTTAGKVEIATSAEFIASTDTGWSGAPVSVPPSVIQTAVRWAQLFIAWEAITALDLVRKEELFTWQVITTLPWRAISQLLWNTAANTRTSIRIIGNGVASSSLVLSLAKVASPTDNVTVRVETDDGTGKPSGTLADANATASVTWSGLTTSQVATTCTLAWSVTLSNNTPYHIVIARSTANDAVNHYSIGGISKVSRSFVTNLYNASWGTASTVNMYYLSYTGCYSSVIVKASAATTSTAYYIGVCLTTTAIWWNVPIQIEGSNTVFSWLTKWSVYYISDTFGAISTTAGTIPRIVWYATDTTNLYIINARFNNTLFDQTTKTYESVVTYAAATTTNTFYYRADTLVGLTSVFSTSGGNESYWSYKNNTAVTTYASSSWTRSDTITLIPWDEVYIVGVKETGTYTLSISIQQLLLPVWNYK